MDVRNEKGQITVFLALIFLVLMGVSFFIIEGMRIWQQNALVEDSFEGAGQDVLANYDRILFERYHVFFMDPREKKYMISDGMKYMEQYSDYNTFLGFHCRNLNIKEEVSMTSEEGLYLKHQIREWMKYKEVEKAGEKLLGLLKKGEESEEKKDSLLGNVEKAKKEEEIQQETKKEETKENQILPNNGDTLPEENGEENAGVDTEENTEEKIRWKKLKDTLDMIFKSGILTYVMPEGKTISSKQADLSGVPSHKKGMNSTNPAEAKSMTFTDLSEVMKLLGGDQQTNQQEDTDTHLLTDDYYMLSYIFSCFHNYLDQTKDGDTVLSYEVEYMISGKEKDMENLKAVANRILLSRFLLNFACASSDAELKGKAAIMATGLTGFLGLPEAEKAVEVLLLSAISYGESLLELHALFAGEKICAGKTPATWNLSFETAASKLINKASVKKGKINVGYKEYLLFFLVQKVSSKKMFYRMMDLMQINTVLQEPGFLAEECLFSFRCEAEISCGRWFATIPLIGVFRENQRTINLTRVYSY